MLDDGGYSNKSFQENEEDYTQVIAYQVMLWVSGYAMQVGNI